MSLTQFFTARARGEGLVNPGFGPSIAQSNEYREILARGETRRRYAAGLLAGQPLAGLRLDGVPVERRDSVAQFNAYAVEWARYLHNRFPGAGARLDAHMRGGMQFALSFAKQLDPAVRMDATVPMASQGLTYFVPEVYHIRHAELPCWDGQILDIARDMTDPAANEYVWYEADNIGLARASNSYDITTIPMVNGPIASSNLGKIIPALVGMETNFMDPRRENFASSQGKPDFQIEVMKRQACERTLAEFANALWFGGDGTLGIDGLMNHPIVETMGITGGAWAGKTALDILDDLKQMVWAIPNRTQGSLGDLGKIEIILPPDQYQILIQPQTAAGSASIMEYFIDFFRKAGHGVPKISMQYMFAASNSYAYNGGPPVLAEDTALIIYKKGDRWDPRFVLSQPIEVPAPVRTTGVGDVTYYHMRVGGMVLPDAQRLMYVVGM